MTSESNLFGRRQSDNALFEAKLADICEKVKEHDEFVNGNGKPGAKTTMALIQSSINDMEKKLNSIMALGGAMLGAVLIDLILRVIGKVY